MDTSMNTHRHLTPKALADRWSCSQGWLANQRSTGNQGPPYVKLGTKVLYPLDRIEAYEASRLVAAGA